MHRLEGDFLSPLTEVKGGDIQTAKQSHKPQKLKTLGMIYRQMDRKEYRDTQQGDLTCLLLIFSE
jgi:hypothetical protein